MIRRENNKVGMEVAKMRRIGFLIFTFLMLILLAGCVSIPLTDGGSIEISADGISINQAETDESEGSLEEEAGTETGTENGEVVPETDGTVSNETDTGDSGDDVKVEEEGQVEGEQSAETEVEAEAGQSGVVEGFGGCENEFYLTVNRLPKDFPIPPCAPIKNFELLVDAEDNTRTIVIHYEDYGLLKDGHETYKTYFAGAGYAVSDETLNELNGTMTASGHGIEMTVNNMQTGSEDLLTEVYYKETPVKKYEIVESIINQTGNGFGKCSDEYYTLLAHLTPDFPMGECVEITFLKMTNINGNVQGAGAYMVGGPWAQEYESYLQYAKDKNYEITFENGQATQGGLDFENDETALRISIENRGLTNAKVQINFSPTF